MATVSTHVLDTSTGRPARAMEVTLESDSGRLVGSATTDADGRIAPFGSGPPEPPTQLEPGGYRLRFDTGAWFATTGTPGFYPEVTITFTIVDADEHYHVPLLLNPFGYSTYRGS